MSKERPGDAPRVIGILESVDTRNMFIKIKTVCPFEPYKNKRASS